MTDFLLAFSAFLVTLCVLTLFTLSVYVIVRVAAYRGTRDALRERKGEPKRERHE